VTDHDFDSGGGNGDGAGHQYDPGLTARIMSAIDDYSRENGVEPSPTPLRDTMLAVAALLHLEATRAARGASQDEHIGLDAFAEAAREQLFAVIHASGHKPSSVRQ
jgi:hypothetical protein